MFDYHYSFFFFYYYQIMRCFNLCQIFLPEPNAIVNQWIIFGLFLVDCPRYRRITPLSGGTVFILSTWNLWNCWRMNPNIKPNGYTLSKCHLLTLMIIVAGSLVAVGVAVYFFADRAYPQAAASTGTAMPPTTTEQVISSHQFSPMKLNKPRKILRVNSALMNMNSR